MTSDLASMIQHAVGSAAMTDAAELERHLAALVDEIAAVQAREHALVRERNDVMRELNREYGVTAPELQERVGVKSLPLVYRIMKGENR